MKVRELVARFSFQSEGLNKVKNGMQNLIDKMRQADKQAMYTEKQLKEMGAFQDKLGRWHSSNGKFLKIDADTSRARANILGLQNSMQSLANGAKMVGQALVAAFAVDRIVAFTQAIQKSADEMMNLDGRLRTITSTDVERYEIEDNLYDLSQQNRQGMKEMGNLYFKIANGTKKYGFNNDDFMRATDIVSKSLTIGGASTAEAQSTILQLGQALGSGFLMGDELNSLNENAQPLMQKIAEYFGKDIGELKEMGSERELKSEDIMKAILAAGDAMDAEFAKMPTTIGQSLQQIENLWNYSMLRIEQGTGVFSYIAKAISNNVLYISDVVTDLMTFLDYASKNGIDDEWLNRFQDGYPILFTLYEGFSALKDIIMEISNVFKPFVDELNSLDRYDVFYGIVNGLQEMFSGLTPYIEPFIQAIARLVQALFPILKDEASSLAPTVAAAFVTIANAIGYLLQALTWVINKVAEFAEENPEFVKLAVEITAGVLALNKFASVLGKVGSLITNVKNAIKGFSFINTIANALSGFAPLINLIRNIGGILGKVFSVVSGLLLRLVPIIFSVISSLGAGLIAILSSPFTWIIALIIFVAYLIYSNWSAIVDFIGTKFIEFLNWVSEGLSGIANFFSGAAALVAELANSIIQGGVNAVSSLVSGFSEGINNIKGFFSDLGSSALSVLQEIANAIQNWVMDKIQWAIDGINNLRNFASSMIDSIGNSISNAYNNYESTQNNTFNFSNTPNNPNSFIPEFSPYA